MILIFKSFNQDTHFFFLKFILLFLLIEYSNINIFNFDIVGNYIISFFKIFFIIWYSLLLSLPFFYYLSRLVPSFCVYSSIIGNLIRVDFLRDIGPGLMYGAFISENCNKRLSKIK